MKSKVFFASAHASSPEESYLEKIPKILKRSGFLASIGEGSRVAVKIHPGERGNLTYIRPAVASRVVRELTARGFAPFVTETTTLYCRQRFTARDLKKTAALNGFTSDALGCLFLIADEEPDLPVRIDGDVLESVKVASRIASADALLVLTHVTLHLWTAGLAASIKQLGMGCTGRRTKFEIHRATTIITDEERCDGCGSCAEICKSNAVELIHGKAFRTEKCSRCGVCIGACLNEALSATHDYRTFMKGLAEAASGVMRKFAPGRALFLNFLTDITWHCDCEDFSDVPVFPDIGLVASSDPVAADAACARMINSALPVSGSRAGSEEIIAAKDKIKALSGIDWHLQLEFGEKVGLGSKSYVFEEI